MTKSARSIAIVRIDKRRYHIFRVFIESDEILTCASKACAMSRMSVFNQLLKIDQFINGQSISIRAHVYFWRFLHCCPSKLMKVYMCITPLRRVTNVSFQSLDSKGNQYMNKKPYFIMRRAFDMILKYTVSPVMSYYTWFLLIN